ncbi:MAG TPA: PIG-L family deacetylase [Solirubrobacteraceae bacterium]|nr:PIG-L family deacetylase [Solirubrobacteraceae bacterium]
MTPPVAILSPHLDDAVLSCWHVLTSPADVRVVNVFAGVPSANVAPGWWDTSSGRHDPVRTVKERIEEDRTALALIGRDPVNLDFLDNQYRSGPQAIEPMVDAVLGILPWGAVVWAPGAFAPQAGHMTDRGARREPHPDHVAVRSAALALRAKGYAVALYADLPHASVCGWPDWVINDGDSGRGRRAAELWRAGLAAARLAPVQLIPEVRRLSPVAFERKAQAVQRYASQVATIEHAIGRRLDDPELLGYEVAWRLPAVEAAS